jgi:TatD DNase family protein
MIKAPVLTSYADTHAHLDGYGQELSAVLQRATAAGVSRIVAVGVDTRSSRHALALVAASEKQRIVTGGGLAMALAVGLHPHNAAAAATELPALREIIRQALDYGIRVAVGEMGLDYYRNRAPQAVQRSTFWAQVELAHELKLPIIIHDRDAHDDVLSILQGAAPLPAGGVMHCYSGDLPLALAAIDLGMHISIAGPVTFANGGRLRELSRRLPLDRLLVETDCPYMSPVPHRGKPNEPAYVVYTAKAVAQLRPEGEQAALLALWRNSGGLFFGDDGLPPEYESQSGLDSGQKR